MTINANDMRLVDPPDGLESSIAMAEEGLLEVVEAFPGGGSDVSCDE